MPEALQGKLVPVWLSQTNGTETRLDIDGSGSRQIQESRH